VTVQSTDTTFIFLSHSSEDREKIRHLASTIEQMGWDVWWSPEINIGERWPEVVQAKLKAASCVVVAWTERAVSSKWVMREARFADDAGKLVPVLIEKVQIPWEFSDTQTADLTDWSGEAEHAGFKLLVESLSRMAGKPLHSVTEAPGPPPLAPAPDEPVVQPQTDKPVVDVKPSLSEAAELANVHPLTESGLPPEPVESEKPKKSAAAGRKQGERNSGTPRSSSKKKSVEKPPTANVNTVKTEPQAKTQPPVFTASSSSSTNSAWDAVKLVLSVAFWVTVGGFGLRACMPGKLTEIGTSVYQFIAGKPSPTPIYVPIFPSPSPSSTLSLEKLISSPAMRLNTAQVLYRNGKYDEAFKECDFVLNSAQASDELKKEAQKLREQIIIIKASRILKTAPKS
jgi:hypothetical protein